MSVAVRAKLAMLAADEGDLGEAEASLTALIETLQQDLAGQDRPGSVSAFDLGSCLEKRAMVRAWAVKLAEARADLDLAERLAAHATPLSRRTLLVGVLQGRAALLGTRFSPEYDADRARATVERLRELEPPAWMVAAVELRLAEQEQAWADVIRAAETIVGALEPRQLMRGVNAARSSAARAWLALGQAGRAAAPAEAAWDFFREHGPPFSAADAALALARARGRQEDWPLVEEALTRTEDLVRGQRTLFAQQRYLVENLGRFNDALRFALQLLARAPAGGARRAALVRAWQVAERSKSFSLRQAMLQGRWLQTLAPALAGQLSALEDRIDALELRAEASEPVAGLLAALYQERKELLAAAQANRPMLGAQMAAPFDLEALVRQHTAAGVGLVSWYWLEEDGGWNLHIFHAGPDGELGHLISAWSKDEVKALDVARAAMATAEPFWMEQPLPPARADKVFPPQLIAALAGCHTLLLTPHRSLRQLPLQAAELSGAGGEGSFGLVERFAVQVLPTLMLPFPDGPGARTTSRVLLLGCVQDGFGHAKLQGVRTELDKLDRCWSRLDHPVSKRALEPGDRLDDHAPVSSWPAFDVIHVACHGSFQPERPLDATLYLGGQALRAAELFQVRLQARVVCLSACDLGQHADTLDDLVLVGDEWLGLALPLFQSGARAVMSSLWRANSQQAVSFMETFHAELAGGASLARAHQLACLQLRAHLEFGLWANWQLAGFPELPVVSRCA